MTTQTGSTEETIAVVGGGVSGLTTALLLQLSGLQTTLYSSEMATSAAASARLDPRFASVHAAASVLPHSVRSPSMSRWTQISQTVFESLAFLAECGVRVQRHFEIFESDVSLPEYWDALRNPVAFRGEELPPGVPTRAGASQLAGWSFDAYFCEGPTYLRFLHQSFVGLGGKVTDGVERAPLTAYLDGQHAIVINCCGIDSQAFLDGQDELDAPGDGFSPLRDTWGCRLIRGHWLRLALAAPLAVRDVGFMSYNYTPSPDVYPGPEQGSAADVYCYPRSDAWVLGGSRQASLESAGGERWTETQDVEHLEFTGASGTVFRIPAPILTLNDELIAGVTDGEIRIRDIVKNRPNLLKAGIGYRFERSHPEEGIRLEPSRARVGGRDYAVVHNYGHGGAGFTLSWGCAYDVLAYVRRLLDSGWTAPTSSALWAFPDPLHRFLQGILEKLSEYDTAAGAVT